MKKHFHIFICIGLLLGTNCFAQVSSMPEQNWTNSTPFFFSHHIPNLELSHNKPEMIRQELLDTNTIRLIGKFSGLTDSDLANLKVNVESDGFWFQVYWRGNSQKASEILGEQLQHYAVARQDGHTRAFVLAALTNQTSSSAMTDPGARAIATNRTLVPISWLKQTGSGTYTNQAGRVVSSTIFVSEINGKAVTNKIDHIPKVDEICRWTSYALVDGEVAWQYVVYFKADSSVDYIIDNRCDAKEYDPKYEQMIKEVENEVENEMKQEGTYRKFGSVHRFWHLKKDKLKSRGADWRAPSELNPGTSYD